MRQALKEEWRLFLTALMFFTRLPCPSWIGYSDEQMRAATRYLPLMGWVVGGFAALMLGLALMVGLPLTVAVMAALVAGILVTGALHEDGFADICDGFGGGMDKAAVLRIMKDSRVGAYAALGLVLLVLLRYLVLLELARGRLSGLEVVPAGGASPSLLVGWLSFGLLLMAGHSVSRFMIVLFIANDDYVRFDEAGGKAKPVASGGLSRREILQAAVGALLPVLACRDMAVVGGVLAAVVAWLLFARYCRRRIGGYTGDCLGATQQLTELAFYLAVLAL